MEVPNLHPVSSPTKILWDKGLKTSTKQDIRNCHQAFFKPHLLHTFIVEKLHAFNAELRYVSDVFRMQDAALCNKSA